MFCVDQQEAAPADLPAEERSVAEGGVGNRAVIAALMYATSHGGQKKKVSKKKGT